jgi:hypothetical protein
VKLTTNSLAVVQLTASFAGRAGNGPIPIPGLTAGDRVIGTWIAGKGYFAPGSCFEDTITVADEIQQLDSSDWSAHQVEVRLLRGG